MVANIRNVYNVVSVRNRYSKITFLVTGYSVEIQAIFLM